jgi:hypothetical protein
MFDAMFIALEGLQPWQRNKDRPIACPCFIYLILSRLVSIRWLR